MISPTVEIEMMGTKFKEPRVLDGDEVRAALHVRHASPEMQHQLSAYHEAGHAVVALAQRGGQLYGDVHLNEHRGTTVVGCPRVSPTGPGCPGPDDPMLTAEGNAGCTRCLRRQVLADLAGFQAGPVAESLLRGFRSSDHDAVLGYFERISEDGDSIARPDAIDDRGEESLDDCQRMARCLWAWGQLAGHPWSRLWRYYTLVRARAQMLLIEQSEALRVIGESLCEHHVLRADEVTEIALAHWVGQRPDVDFVAGAMPRRPAGDGR